MTKGAIKAIAICLATVLVGALVAAGVGSAKGGKPFKNPHIETWFDNWGKPAANDQTEAQTWGGVIDNVGNELNAEATYAMPAAMAFYSDVAAISDIYSNPTVTVTCSHNFEFNNVLVDWSIEYPSGASATDVVTVTPTSDGSLTANVSCTAPFDTQLTLKATLRGNSEKTATCTIDYVKRIETINNITINASDFDEDSGLSCSPSFGIGTVTGNLRLTKITWFIERDFEDLVQNYLKFKIDFNTFTAENKILDNTYYSYDGENITYSTFINDFDSYDEAHKNAIYYAWYTAAKEFAKSKRNNIILDCDFDLLYNGVIVDSFTELDYIQPYGHNSLSGDYYGDELAPDLTLNNNVVL